MPDKKRPAPTFLWWKFKMTPWLFEFYPNKFDWTNACKTWCIQACYVRTCQIYQQLLTTYDYERSVLWSEHWPPWGWALAPCACFYLFRYAQILQFSINCTVVLEQNVAKTCNSWISARILSGEHQTHVLSSSPAWPHSSLTSFMFHSRGFCAHSSFSKYTRQYRVLIM